MALQNPEQEKLLRKPKRKSKYGNTKIELDGMKFDSIAEAARYVQLKDDQERFGFIKDLEVKPVYRFKSGVKYIPDFRYQRRILNPAHLASYEILVEDVKGAITREFSIKRKLLRSEYGLDINIVRMDANVAHALVKGYLNEKR